MKKIKPLPLDRIKNILLPEKDKRILFEEEQTFRAEEKMNQLDRHKLKAAGLLVLVFIAMIIFVCFFLTSKYGIPNN